MPTTVSELRCPAVIAPGETAIVDVTHSLFECCSPAGASVVASRRSAREVELTTTWDRCECCELCDCVTPPAMQAIGIGMFDVGPITVRAGDQTCTIEVRAPECRAARVDEAHAPLTVAIGEPIPVLVRANAGVSCGCRPRAIERVGREGGEYAGIEACECSDDDPCVDPGYEGTAMFAPGTSPSARAISSDDTMVGVEVVDRARCASGTIRVRSIRIEAPSERLISEQPAGYWAVLDAEARYCCAGPRSLVELRDTTSPFAISLEVLDCVEADCDCDPPAPTDWEHWHYLGPLAPGAYTLSAGAVTTMFVVP